jgi:molybdopterin molybdotransferase
VSLATVAQARERMLAALAPLGDEAVALADAAGRVLAQAIAAHRPQPPFAASAMDGWAVAADPAERCLAIIGESAAGRGFAGRIHKGSAVRIFTGAAVPAGADAVVIQEEASRQGERVRVPPCVTGQNIRPAGQDFRPGEVLLAAGLRLDPWRLGLAAAAGLGMVRVARRPRIAILATGEELVFPGETPGPFQIFNSGTPTLAALVRAWGAEALCLPTAADSAEAIVGAVRAAECEVLVTLGGASVGDYDLVKPPSGRASRPGSAASPTAAPSSACPGTPPRRWSAPSFSCARSSTACRGAPGRCA